MTDLNQASLFKRLHASLVPNTLEKEIMEHIDNQHIQINLGKQEAINWQEAYQKLFVEQDKHLTRAIKAEETLATAKLLLADQEIKLKQQVDTISSYAEAVRAAATALVEARRTLDKINPYGAY